MKQILISGVLGLFLSLIGTPVLIKLLARKGYGQFIRDDGPQNHHSKRGTPTMGGIAFILATVVAYAATKLIVSERPTISGLLVLFLFAGMGLVGFLDDYIKIVKQRSLGLRAKAKMAGQLIVGITFAILSLNFADQRGATPASTKLSFTQDFGWSIGPVIFVIWALFMILAMSNGVNLTDGLDGLATGASVMVFAAYTVIGVWQYGQSCANPLTAGPGLLRGTRPARPRGGGRRPDGRLLRLPVVEHLAGEDLHGRHRLARPRRRAGRPGDLLAHRTADGDPGRAVRPDHPVGGHAGRLFPAHRTPGVQNGAAAAPLRTQGLERGPDRGPLLDHPGHVHGGRTRPVLRGLRGGEMTEGAPGMSTADELRDRHVTVAGLGVSGVPAARALLELGARVTVLNGSDGQRERAEAEELRALGATVLLGDATKLPGGTDLVVTTPGWKPSSPLFAAAAAAGVPVWGDVELAWRLRAPGAPDWLAVTGTNGKTTTVGMLAAILTAAGLRTAAVGNIGVSLVDVVRSAEPYDVLAVELSSYQLHWAPSVRAHSAAVLNLAPDHLDWHGSMAEYAAAKGRVYEGNRIACVYNAADPATEELVREADVVEGCRAIGFTLGAPAPSQFGVVDGILVDRAFVADRHGSAQELAEVADITPPAPHNVADALAAAALARAYGVPPRAVREGLRAFRPDAHRIAHVATVDGVDYVDDSKATNTHAAAASLAAYEHIVWLAGGLAKGATFDDLVGRAADRLRAVVLMGADRALIAEALRRHAPKVPVVELERTDTGAMAAAVAAATEFARPGDTVLLAPACASMDMFLNYGKRGDAFAEAVRDLPTQASQQR